MGLRSPGQTLNRSNEAPVRTPQYRAIASSQIDTGFVDTLDKSVVAKKKALEKKQKQIKDFIEATFKNDADTLRVQAESELSNQQGMNALEQSPSIKQQYIKNLDERFDKIPDQFKNDLDLRTAYINKVGQYDRFQIPYVNSQSKKVADDAFKTRTANEMNTVVDNATDLDYIEKKGIPDVEAALYKKLTREYGSDIHAKVGDTTVGEIVTTEMKAGVSKTIVGAVTQQVLVEDFNTAGETVRRFYDRITPSDREKISKIISKGLKDSRDNRSLELTEQAWAIFGRDPNLVRVDEYLRKASGGDSDLYRKAVGLFNTQIKMRDKQKEYNEDDITEKIYNDVIGGGQLDQRLFRQLPPEKRDKLVSTLNKNNGGEAVVTDVEERSRIEQQIERMTPEEFTSINVDKRWGMHLSAQDRNVIRTRQNNVRQQISKDWQGGQRWNDNIPKSVATNFANANLLPKSDRAKLEWAAKEEYARLIEENPRITTNDLYLKLRKAVYDRAFRTEKQKRFFGFLPFVDEYKEVQVLSDSLAPARNLAIHPTWVRSVQEERIRRGQKTMGESELMRFFEYLKSQDPSVDLSKPRP